MDVETKNAPIIGQYFGVTPLALVSVRCFRKCCLPRRICVAMAWNTSLHLYLDSHAHRSELQLRRELPGNVLFYPELWSQLEFNHSVLLKNDLMQMLTPFCNCKKQVNQLSTLLEEKAAKCAVKHARVSQTLSSTAQSSITGFLSTGNLLTFSVFVFVFLVHIELYVDG